MLTRESLDATLLPILDSVTAGDAAGRVPGVAAAVTDRKATVFEAAAGSRSLSTGAPVTTDTVLAMFSTTKAVTGTAALQCVEDGLVDLDAPTATYVPELGEVAVIEGFDAWETRSCGHPNGRSRPECCSCTPPHSATRSSWLNEGDGPGGRVLKSATVRDAVVDGLDGRKITSFRAVEPEYTNAAEFFPGQTKSWAMTFMVNDEPAPTGRPAGALGWAGLANLYYWMDRSNGVAGIWGTQILPFADAVSLGGYLNFETEVYRMLRS